VKCLLIDGQLVHAGRTFTSVNPRHGEVLDQAPNVTVGQAAARCAFDTTSRPTDLQFRVSTSSNPTSRTVR
jgi:acyl-CoA reductase-like NAD-dependent aldehyde dehydrogenase